MTWGTNKKLITAPTERLSFDVNAQLYIEVNFKVAS